MKIAFFIPHLTRKPGFENNVSAHVQLPCEIARRLRDCDCHVEILTDSLVEGFTMPACLPEGINVIPMVSKAFVTSADRAPLLKAVSFVFLFISMAMRIRKRVVREQYDVVHFYGTERILLLSRLVGLLPLRSTLVMTFNQCIQGTFYERIRGTHFLWRQLDAVVVSMEQMAKRVPSGNRPIVIRHGIIKDLSRALELDEGIKRRKRVLFWRTPDHLNGGDICIEVFRKLAPLYPDIDFDLAIRAESIVADLDAYEHEVQNGHVYRFPYPEDVSLESLLADSICVFQPFREYTYHPQFVILESLMLGIPVVASDLPGIEEMVDTGKTGYTFPLDQTEIAVAGIRKILAGEISSSAEIRERVNASWSWNGYEDRLLEVYRSLV